MYGTMTHQGTHSGLRVGRAKLVAAAPLALLPGLAFAMFMDAPAWQLMWVLAFSIYFGCKWLTFASCRSARHALIPMALGYLLLWPGMDATAFFDGRSRAAKPGIGEWALALFNLTTGLVLLFVVTPRITGENAMVAGWIGMIGLVFVLHFGLFHVMSLGWRLNAVDAQPLMNFPILSTSLSDFWGRRWNSAFRHLAFTRVFRPLLGRMSVAWATMVVFLVSGLIHDLILSVPVHGGWGRPTIYFVLQGIGLLAERSRLGRRLGCGRGLTGRLMCALFVLTPLGLLFHEPFVRHAILPTLAALGIR